MPPSRNAAPSSGMSSNDKKKVIIAGVMLALAGLLIAYTMGMFDSVVRPAPQQPKAEAEKLNQEVQKAVQERERQEKEGKAPPTAGS